LIMEQNHYSLRKKLL